MSQKNVEIVTRAMEAYLGGDKATVRELSAPDIVISGRPDQPDVRDHRGYDGMLQASAEWLEAWGEHSIEPARVWDVEDFVFVAARESGRGKISGVLLATETTFVFTVSEGRIVRIQIFGSEHEALEAVGLAE
ncbi:MAG TPA: nuclear transport factor 2 family protein [Solirubrobacteraceae bacterium]|jgi:ketosteroid isomerase-like protein